ncbi:AAA family ATPase [Candidatus Micrarchaeota archaeon]|nr:AAA family ATPase [Candidatus Micrarchaeota archaeon]
MIRLIHLINWRSHSDSKLDFSDGTNLLVGIMGAGKSSVLEGISFALFGTFPSLERRKVKLEDLMRLNEPITKVFLEFVWEGATYRLERVIERNKRGTSSAAEVFKNTMLVESGPVAVNTYVQNLLQIDYDLFTRAIYSEQNNIDYFLTLDPRRRKQEVDTLLGLDKFELARTNIISVIGRIRSKREGVEERFSVEKVSEVSAKEQEKAKELLSLEAKLRELLLTHEEQTKQLSKSTVLFQEMKKKKDIFELLSKEMIRLTAQQDSLKAEVALFNPEHHSKLKLDYSSLLAEKNTLAAQIKSVDEIHLKSSKEISVLETKIKSTKESSDKIQKLRKDLELLLGGAGKTPAALIDDQKSAEQKLLSFESEKRSIEKELIEISDILKNLKPGLSECPLCSSKLAEHGIEHIKNEKTAKIEEKNKQLAELSRILLTERKALEELSSKNRKISSSLDLILSLEKSEKNAPPVQDLITKKSIFDLELSKTLEQKFALATNSEQLTAKLDQYRIELSKLESLALKQKTLAETEKKIVSNQENLKLTLFDEQSFEKLRTETESLKLSTERLSSQKRELETSSRMLNDMLKVLRDDLATLKLMEQEAKELIRLESELLIYKNALLETQTSLRENVVDAINSAMNEIWTIFYPYRNYSALRLEVSDKDYLFQVSDGQNQNWKPLESIASGGERACAALTLRVALATVLVPKLSWLILDEPTHNLDRQAVELLSSALQFKVPEVVKQTFVITHEEALIGSEFASSYRLSRDKEHNKETQIERI